MKLTYPIPHRVTCRMVGAMFVASCTCKKWAAQVDPRKYDQPDVASLGSFLRGILPVPTEELIATAHKHATDHVLERQGIARKVAA